MNVHFLTHFYHLSLSHMWYSLFFISSVISCSYFLDSLGVNLDTILTRAKHIKASPCVKYNEDKCAKAQEAPSRTKKEESTERIINKVRNLLQNLYRYKVELVLIEHPKPSWGKDSMKKMWSYSRNFSYWRESYLIPIQLKSWIQN